MFRKVLTEFGRCLRETGQALDHLGLRAQNSEIYKAQFSRHRNIMGLYDKQPQYPVDSFIAPSSSVIGEVSIGSQSSVWYNAVIRGDVNEINIGGMTHILDGAVIGVSKTNPLGFPASTYVGHYVSIGQGATLTSCTIEDESVVGSGAVIGEGALVEKHSMVGPGSVVPSGRRIPSGQLWVGNPAQYERDLTEDEISDIKKKAEEVNALANEHAHEFLPFGTAYLEAEKLSQ